MPENIEDIPPPDPALFGAPPAPSTIEEALQQRLEKYKQDEAKAKQVVENLKLYSTNYNYK